MSNTDFYPAIGSAIRQYQVIDIAGTGGTAIVLKCLYKRTGEIKALKRFFQDKLTREFEKKIEKEPRLGINSGFLVMAEESFREDGFLHSAMPFVEGDNLCDILDANNNIGAPSAIYTSLCLAKAADDLHSSWIVSADIKPENTIITGDGTAKLIDLSNYETIGFKPEVSGGTMPYAAPELLNRDYLSARTDIYSIGVVLCEMLAGKEKFEKMTGSWELETRRGIKPNTSFLWSAYPDAARIIDKAIAPDPRNRHESAHELFEELLEYYNLLTGAAINNAELKLLCGQGKRIYVPKGRTVLGRDRIDSANLVISEEHFEIDFDGTEANIRDAGSTNGTSVNGNRIGSRWMKMRNTDVIQIADFQIEVRILQ